MGIFITNRFAFAVFLVLLAFGAIVWLGAVQKYGAISLGAAEVESYQGKDLSSISDFHENSIKGPQFIDPNKYRLAVYGLVEKPLNLTYSEAINRQAYSKVVTLNCVEGWSATILWEGVLLSDIIGKANPLPEANTVIFHSYDGYYTTLPLSYVRDRQILLAYKMNNVTLPPARGFPFQVVAEDKYGYKWAKWVTGIELGNDPDYRGYWERFGYSQNGSTSGPIFEKGAR